VFSHDSSFAIVHIVGRFGLFNSHFARSFLARDRIYAIVHALYAIARPSVRLSVTRVDQSKTIEVRIMQPSPQSSPMTIVF